MLPAIVLKPGREKPVLAHHPWVFSGAIARTEGEGEGETVVVRAADGRFLARASYNPRSQIAARIWTWADEPVDRAFLRGRLERAAAARFQLGLEFRSAGAANSAFRLVNAESDLLPGLIVDVYADFLVVQFLTLGVEQLKSELISLLAELFEPRGIYERSDQDVRGKEGLPETTGVLFGEPPPERIEIRENGLVMLVDVLRGNKTGFYLDQRDNRRRFAELVTTWSPAGEIEALNAFAYTGSFGVVIGSANARACILNLDASADSLALARENLARNGLGDRSDYREGDAFQVLRGFRDAGRQFDLIVLDPPKFAHSQGQVNSACRGYKDLNLLAFKLLRMGGLLTTFSCSGLVSTELFQKVVWEAANDAGRQAQILARLSQAADHPTLLSFPEGEYLKGLILRVG